MSSSTKIIKMTSASNSKGEVTTNKIPVIGIVGHMLPNGNSMGATLPYITYFERFGDVKVILPTSRVVDTTLDLLVIPGGPDISVTRYLNKKDRVSWFNQKPDNLREYFDVNILPKYIEEKIPVFGICRGHQSIAVLYGAKLEQDLIFHERSSEEKRWEVAHRTVLRKLEIDEEEKILTTTKYAVNIGTNSLHHQAVITVPDNAVVIAWTDEKLPKNSTVFPYDPGNKYHAIEGLAYTHAPIVTVQWHPEEMDTVEVFEIIDDLIKCSPNF